MHFQKLRKGQLNRHTRYRPKVEKGSVESTVANGKLPAAVKSSQVKSSQVKFKMAVAFPPPLVPIAGAIDREGRSRRNRHHWIAPSRGIIPIFLILIIAAPHGFIFVPFSGSLLYGNATRRQFDDGRDRGLREGCSDGPRRR